MKRAAGALLLLGLVVACDEPAPVEPVCSEGTASAALTTVDRKIIGDAAPYESAALGDKEEGLRASQRDRRVVAWQAVAKVLEQVPIAETLPNGADLPNSVARWQTWYDFDDVRRVFHRLYEDLTPEQRAARAAFTDDQIEAGMAWNVGALDELPNWTEEAYGEYLAAIDDAAKVAGLGGVSRVMYSPGAARHILKSYPEVLACRENGAPAAVEGSLGEPELVAEPQLELEACAATELGPYSIIVGETLRVGLDASEGANGATLTASSGSDTCEAAAGEACELEGPAEVSVRVSAGGRALEAQVSVLRLTPEVEWASCLDGPFPADAVIVKADYRRADFDMKLPVYDTSAAGLAGQLSGDAEWHTDVEADPGPATIHTLTMPAGSTYRLAALHIMTKELDHWLWVTLWWSDKPNEDFGADRPSDVAALPGAWENYKMCAVTAFEERDEAPGGGFDESQPSLAAALSAVYGGVGAPTWCSNPYLEEGHGNASTNCIGCHQHGGTDLASEGILTYDDFGRTQLRNNFPTDYSWAFVDGDEIGRLFQQEEQYWQTR